MSTIEDTLHRPGIAATEAVVPRATYRLQLHRDFRFADAMAWVPYLAALGVSHLYISPPLRARPGSTHGYDVVDHDTLNPELGTRADFDALVTALRQRGMGLIIDIVPNHMGVLGGDNAWWLDVLENGAASAYAGYFDIDWQSADPALTGKVLLPILGDQYGIALERGELRLSLDRDSAYITLSYFDHKLPIDPSAYTALLRQALRTRAVGDGAAGRELRALTDAFDRLPKRGVAEARGTRQRDKRALKARLAQCLKVFPAVADAIDQVLDGLNGRVGDRASFDALDTLLEVQPYRLAQWRVAGDQINYRRFFDINELAALRMEDEAVFEATHRLVLALTASGAVDGLRIDHPDGLADPAGYFRRLQRRHAELAGLPAHDDSAPLPLYVVVEKIVAPHENVPADWAVHGTTGYRFANVVNAVLVERGARARLDRAWRAFVGDEAEEFELLSRQGRHAVMDGALAGELTVLATALLRLAREDRRTRDFTLHALREALSEVVASFPVYRTYVIDKPSAQDRKFIDWAIGQARRLSLAADASIFDFLRRVLLGRPLPGAPAGLGERYRTFARRLQQYTAPVVAKGIEDTALYRHQRLISLNDVGGDPDDFGLSVAAFHAINQERVARWPHAMLTTSTHDAKRSEDVRARIDVISEMPAAWRLAVRRWSRINRRLKRQIDGTPAPSRNDEYLLYQTLVGSWPAEAADEAALAGYAERIEQTMLKSARESKSVTSWMNPNLDYETALSGFVRAVLAPGDGNLFLADFREAAALIAWYGALNSLSLVILKALSPGVPDFYQGCEAIELLLVDPDNRRAVDFARREHLLADAQALAARDDRRAGLQELATHGTDGRAKFWATWRTLQLRERHAAVLRDGHYLPLEVRGDKARHALAFARRDDHGCVVAVVPRLVATMGLALGEAPLGECWGDTHLVWPEAHAAPPAGLVCAISGQRHSWVDGTLALAQLLGDFPVAALGSSLI